MWKGPKVDGVTQSMMARFMRCPYCFYLYAILGLEEKEELGDNLIWGDSFHKGLEILIATRDKKDALAGMKDYLMEEYNRPEYFPSLGKMLMLYSLKGHMDEEWITEEIIDQQVTINDSLFRIRGKRDGICRSHPDYDSLLAEHKCKGYIDPDLIKEELCQDLQVNLYAYLDGTEWVAYDLIKIPDVQKYGPKRNYNDTPSQWADKLYNGPIGSYGNCYPIYKYSHKWMHQRVYPLPREDQERYWDATIRPTILRMDEWYDYVTSPEFEFGSPNSYNSIFYKMPVRHFDGRKTEKFKCEYHGFLTDQIDFDDLTPIPGLFTELKV